ncbi:MAG: aminotransferase class V-fold PLP-dependent enzyme [Pseudomonadota bacterium]
MTSETDALALATAAARDWLAGFETQPAGATEDFETLYARFDATLPERGSRAEDVIRTLIDTTRGGLQGNAGGRFFGWVIGGVTPAALAADWLVSTWDQNAALYHVSPIASVIEQRTGEWLKQLFGLPAESSFALTTGTQMAHATALAAARHRVLAAAGWDVEQDGLFGAPRVAVITGRNRHTSVDRAVRLLGFGQANLHVIDSRADTVSHGELAATLATHGGPAIVVLNAADLNVGGCDPFAELIPVAREHGAWVHIDGAFGLFAAVSERQRPHVAGIELADSWSTDAHKWLNTPFDCGVMICRHAEAHRAAMTQSASYIAPGDGARDEIDWNPEWSRRARAIPVYAALQELGREGVADIVDRCCRLCERIVTGIGALDGAEIVAHAQLNQGLLRFPVQGDEDAGDARTKQVIADINASGEAFFSSTTWNGSTAMRVSLCNWRTGDAEVERAIAAAEHALAKR